MKQQEEEERRKIEEKLELKAESVKMHRRYIEIVFDESDDNDDKGLDF